MVLNLKMAESSSKAFGPLLFEENQENEEYETSCLLCEDRFNLQLGLPIFLCHLFEVHHIVIENVQFIDNLEEYVEYWRERFKNVDMASIVPAVPIETNEKYYLLSTLMNEDKNLRHKLRLEKMLKVQEFERTDKNFKETCLICQYSCDGLRKDYFEHLATQHNFYFGNPQNLVYVDELIQKLKEKFNALQCIYCEGTFPDRNTLKEHMRKRQHKTINPLNREYDKYYAVNYLEPDGSWHEHKKKYKDPPTPVEVATNSDEEYEDWMEKEAHIVCLFCQHKDTTKDSLCTHMLEVHGFAFNQHTKMMDFYQKIKLVNYIRRQIHYLRCILCDLSFENIDRLQSHMTEQRHYEMPDVKTFDQPEFYFPTYENDAFLYFLEEVDD